MNEVIRNAHPEIFAVVLSIGTGHAAHMAADPTDITNEARQTAGFVRFG